MTTQVTVQAQGWYEVNSEGISTIYLTITDEGITTSPTDTPANTQFRPRILDAEQFSIKRAPMVWPWGSTQGQSAAYGQLRIDNYDGAFDFLVGADLRDATVQINLPNAGSLLSGTAIASSPLIATAILDNVTCDNEDVITITLKDTIARLDKALPARFNPPFVDSAAANQMIPITLGACRNVMPLLIDSPNRLYQIHDANVPNVTLVSDKAAPLDPAAIPPQYTPALSGSGIQLAVLPQGKLVVECSSFGTQAVIPGAQDVLAGAGAFPGTQGATGWFGAINGSAAVVTNGAVTVTALRYTIPTSNTTPFTVAGNAYATDGTNSVYGTIQSITAGVSVTLNVGSTVVGTPTSIPSGSRFVVPGAPTGTTWTATSGSSITEQANPPFSMLGSTNGVRLLSANPFNPGNTYGDQLTFPGALVGGAAYRLTFSLYNVQQQQPALIGGMVGGVVVAMGLSSSPNDYISGIAQPITTSAFKSQNFALEFTVPTGSNRNLYFIIAPSAGSVATVAQGNTIATLFNIKLQKLGTYQTLPLSGIPLADYFTEILVSRAGEASTVFNAADAAALGVRSDGTIIPFGCHFDAPPNILDALRMPLDSLCATMFTDSTGQLRIRRLTDPSEPLGRTIKADFSPVNVERPIQIGTDSAANLTTLMGARRNWSQFSASDFVTDQAIVPQDVKNRYMRPSQFQVTSSKTPAGQYNFAIAAPIFDSVLDLASDAQNEIDRVVGIWSPKQYSDGTFTTGKRRVVTFTAHFDDPSAVGINTTTAVTNLMFGDIVTLTYPSHGFNATPCEIVAWEVFPFAQKIILTALV